MAQHSEGSVFLVCGLPSEWPPAAAAELLSTEQSNALVRLMAHTDGHLSVSVKTADALTQQHFQPLAPTGAGNVILAVVWGGPDGIALSINGNNVPAADDAGGSFAVTPAPLPASTTTGVELSASMLAAMTDLERLFVDTLRDIELRLQGGSPYDLMRLSALLRQLLTDKRSLLNEVNRNYKVPVRFTITERPVDPPPLDPVCTF